MKKKHRKAVMVRLVLRKDCDMKAQRSQIAGLNMQEAKRSRTHRRLWKTAYTLSIKPFTQADSFGIAVKRSIDDTRKKGNPVARYDIQRRQAYLEFPDGKKVYVE